MKHSLLLITIWALGFTQGLAAEPQHVLSADQLDAAAFSQWVGGDDSPVDANQTKNGPRDVVWTSGGRIEWKGVEFGTGKKTGVRHLRIGFTEAVSCGSVLVRGGGQLSVLRSDAPYPGNLADDSQWLPAERLLNGKVITNEVDREEYATWVLPENTTTRAIRFSHNPGAGDSKLSGWLGGVWVLGDRVANIAPQAVVKSVARDDVSAKLIDGTNNNMWSAWDNGENGAALPISNSNPEMITLKWFNDVTLSGLCFLWTGFSTVEIETYTGNAANIQDAPDSSWKTIARRDKMDALYPVALGANWLMFDSPVVTRAVRLRIIEGAKATHSHLESKIHDGKRVWLGELLALSAVESGNKLESLILPEESEEPPPIPIRFTLPEAGEVTLVIEDQDGQRVRNLVSETYFPAGENTVWWDGSDDLLRDPQAAAHGLYHLPTRLVEPGTYTIRGLWRKPLELRYEFSIYNAGKPAWRTEDNTGCWLTTHSPPSSLTCVPGAKTEDGKPLVFIGAYVAEGGHGLQWLQEDGTKLGGQHWVGGIWTGAQALATDTGKDAIEDHLCYVASVWEGELRLTAKSNTFSDVPVFKHKLGEDSNKNNPDPPKVLEGFEGGNHVFVLGGIAAHDGIIVCSLTRQNEVLVIDARTGQIRTRIAIDNPRGLAFDKQGRLLVLANRTLQRINELKEGTASTVLIDGLEDPRQVAIDLQDQIYISDRGNSHQVKVFAADGKALRTIGKPGPPKVGLYDPLHLNNPNELGIDSQGHVWVTEADNHPRRVSVWSSEGELLQTFYGPTEYGGGGVLDPLDKSKFYYKGMEFELDWQTGTDQLKRVFYRPSPLLEAHYGPYSPDTPLYPTSQNGRRYFTSCYTHVPTGGDNVVFIWRDEESHADLVAAVGSARSWEALRTPEFYSSWPEGTHPEEEKPRSEPPLSFSWTDQNGDGTPQTEEIHFHLSEVRGLTVMPDLSVVVSRFDNHCVKFPPTFQKTGLPTYDLTSPQILGPAGGKPQSSGGDQSLSDSTGWTINTNAPEPFSPFGLGGSFKGKARWSYPSVWPGLHASHEAAVPDLPGMVVGHTRLLGGMLNGKIGPMFCVNGNMGNMYLFTADGLFVGSLFHDIRLRPNWAAPVAVRNMDVTDVSLHDENFWPSITQTSDGSVYVVDGARTSLVRVDGLESLRRLPEQTVTVAVEELDQARDWFARAEAKRQALQGSGTLNVRSLDSPPQVDGNLDDWSAKTDWAFIDRRGTKANFNSNSRPYEVSAAIAVTGTDLYAAWRTTEKNLLDNTGETPNALFKHGGCLDLMLATDPTAAADRRTPVAGDQRLLITRIQGQTRALLYKAKVPEKTEPVPFSSPWRTVHIDEVKDVSDQVTLASDDKGNFEIKVPLKVLDWSPQLKETYLADVGVLRGSNGQTTQRVYWSNKATAITADVPSEAELTPRLWGRWRIIDVDP